MSMARLLAPHDVLDDVGGIRTDAGKDGGWLRMQPRQPDGVQPRVRRYAPDVPGILPLIEDWQVHPSERVDQVIRCARFADAGGRREVFRRSTA
jgi:hypothetical protein